MSVLLKGAGLAALAAAFAAIALGPWGNLIFCETIGIGLEGGVLFALYKDRKSIPLQFQARDPELIAYGVGIIAFVAVGVLSLLAGARDIGNLTQA